MAPEGKIKAKDLSYDASLPPFLQRLHAQKAGLGDQDRHERPVARPKGAKRDDEDDGPTVVDESGETVSMADFEKLTKDDAEEGGKVRDTESKDSQDEGEGGKKVATKLTDGTATKKKKRKAIKVVGDEDEEPPQSADGQEDVKTERLTKKPKKAKPVKLAFDDS